MSLKFVSVKILSSFKEYHKRHMVGVNAHTMFVKHMCTSSQPQHDFADECLFWVFRSFHSTTYQLLFYARLNIFFNEVLEHSDLLDPKVLMASTWLQDPSNSGSRNFMTP